MRRWRECDPFRNVELAWPRERLGHYETTKSTIAALKFCLHGGEMAQMAFADHLVNIILVLKILVTDDLVQEVSQLV